MFFRTVTFENLSRWLLSKVTDFFPKKEAAIEIYLTIKVFCEKDILKCSCLARNVKNPEKCLWRSPVSAVQHLRWNSLS